MRLCCDLVGDACATGVANPNTHISVTHTTREIVAYMLSIGFNVRFDVVQVVVLNSGHTVSGDTTHSHIRVCQTSQHKCYSQPTTSDVTLVSHNCIDTLPPLDQ